VIACVECMLVDMILNYLILVLFYIKKIVFSIRTVAYMYM